MPRDKPGLFGTSLGGQTNKMHRSCRNSKSQLKNYICMCISRRAHHVSLLASRPRFLLRWSTKAYVHLYDFWLTYIDTAVAESHRPSLSTVLLIRIAVGRGTTLTGRSCAPNWDSVGPDSAQRRFRRPDKGGAPVTRSIPIEHLSGLPYLDVSNLGSRVVHLMPYWDGERWHAWIPTPDRLMPLLITDTVRADYVAKKPAASSDVLVPFIDIVWQRLSWPEVVAHLSSIIEDFHCLGASWSKLDVFCRERERWGDQVGVFASTELDYLFILARSIFDLLQEMIATLWNGRVRLSGERAEARSKLPKEFRKVVLDGNTVRAAAAIEADFGLPPAMAAIYEHFTPFFLSVREFRDRVVHGIGIRQIIFVTERGFCVDPRSKVFGRFNVWTDASRYNDNLWSLLPLVADVIIQTIDCCNHLVQSFAQQIQLPPEIAPEYHVFTRGYHTSALIRALEISKGASPWPEP